MMGPKQVAQGALFYEFSIEEFVPADHRYAALIAFSICRVFDRFWHPPTVCMAVRRLILS